jgi:RNA polymerase sigma factor (sigma-70 family)
MLVATASISDFLQNLRVSRWRDQGPTDGQLLEVFAHRRDEGAFEALVRRHGPMVLGVCRRILRNNHDAEDAFQATFLVLACKAGVLRPRHMVAGWLYSVACNTALKLRGNLARRRVKEREAAAMPRPQPPSDAWRQLEPLLDNAVRGLPDKYRSPLVLCDLEGKSRKEAARQLGWPEGTVASRLARARQILARRLGRYGLTLSASAVAVVISQNQASACVPPALVKSLAKVGALMAAGQTPAALPARVVELTQGVLKAMFMSKLKIATALFLVLALVALSASLYPTPASPQQYGGGYSGLPKKADVDKPATDQPGKTGEQQKVAAPVSIELPAVVIDEVDLKYKTISVTIFEGLTAKTGTSSTSGSGGSTSDTSSGSSDKPTKLVNLPVDKHVEIYVDRQIVPLGGLKPGMKVSLRLIQSGGTLVATAIGSGKRDDDRSTAVERALREAMAQVEVALAQVELATVQLKKAKDYLAAAQGAEAREKAQTEVEVATAQLHLARAFAAETQVRAERLAAEAQEVRARKNQEK